MRIPVVHVEAGLRAADFMMAEEINRRLVDAISSVLCAPSAAAESRLRLEHVAGVVTVTGDIARDVLLRNAPRVGPISEAPQWPLGRGEPYVFSTLHRAELTDDAAKIRGVVGALGSLGAPVILAAHPRTRIALERHALLDRLPRSVHLLPPFGYLETLACIRDATAVVTDSGGVQREAYWLGTPCVTVRDETEWEETVRLGANVLVSPLRAAEELAAAVQTHVGCRSDGWQRDAYGAGNAARLVRDAIERWSAAETVAG
jgi:UDP-N-acetylglucosamine 2-epimerase